MAAVVAGVAPARTRSRLRRALRAVVSGARRVRLERALPTAALLVAVVLVLVETPLTAAASLPLPLAFVLVIVHAGALPLAVRAPNVAAPLSIAAALVLQWRTADGASMLWPWSPVLIVTQCLVLAAVAARTPLLVALLHWTVAVVLSASLAAWLRPATGDETSVDVAVFASISAALIVVAVLLAQWRHVRSQLLHEQRVAAEESERRVVAEERTRIARELHDVVAHGLSLITVQASTARYRRDVGDEAAEEFDRIAAQSRQALDEMRGLLRVLRGAEDGADHRPQPGLGDLAELVAQAAASGSDVVLDEPDGMWSTGVSGVTGLTAFRIVQEAVSNALRHAPGAQVRVTVRRRGGEIEAVVENTVPTEPVPVPGAQGHGLVGMAERAAGAGGSVESGPTASGGFVVRVVLPVQGAVGAGA
ncbi:sensor histidine kinase [Amnibacterium setariae]|uniref:histidine kinase n=1 Tax=Amnibacterium setariae TaxID=2306585 RepID=A0A3A1TYK7_9MICO|nr:histidine kinase [Amnibacterium setariae]RIX27755.1 histidine kinase [Amnibacterium setariae]